MRPPELAAESATALKMGSTVGFRYMSFKLRGQEATKLIITGSPEHRVKTNIKFDVVKEGHAPESPAPPLPEVIEEKVVYQIGMYTNYGRLMAWCRTRHPEHTFTLHEREWSGSGWHRLGKSEHDLPIILPSTDNWPGQKGSIDFRDVVAELVTLSLDPPPENPFEVDFEHPALRYLEELTGPVGVADLAVVSALISQLHHLKAPYQDLITQDLKRLHNLYSRLAARFCTGDVARS
eukprot:Sspe_Gene.30343::Locus_15012_Transcript_7_15_Confidence_0.206_Length_2566::g.30343::m.30343